MSRLYFRTVGGLAIGLAAAVVPLSPRLLSAAAAPKTQPAGGAGAPADVTPDGKRRLAAGQVEFAPPAPADAWVESDKNRTPTRNVWVSADHSTMLSVEVMPADQKVTADMAASLVRVLKQARAKSGEKQTQDPAIEKDDRFVVRIHEHFTAKDGKPGEQLHLYRAVGPRTLLVTCKTFAGEKAKGELEAAEAASVSATYVKPTPPAKKK